MALVAAGVSSGTPWLWHLGQVVDQPGPLPLPEIVETCL